MTDTINNVPRELLERARAAVASTNTSNWSSDLLRDIHAILSAPSPAGVDGLEVETYLHTMHMELGQAEQFCSKWKGDPFGVSGVDYSSTYSVTSEPLCRLSDAQAIIDGLRGDRKQNDRARMNQFETIGKLHDELDQHAKRIGELEGLLYEASGELRTDRHHGLGPRIDAALSAGKEGE